MDKTELLAIWKELRSIRTYIFQLAMQYEGVQRALEASRPGFRKRRLIHEKKALELFQAGQRVNISSIDAAIQRLELAESLQSNT